MTTLVTRVFALLVLGVIVAASSLGPAASQQAAGRIALVIGEGAYAKGPLTTAANDAGLVAQTLTAAGFDVTGARDLDGDGMRRAFREFIEKANATEQGGVAFVYIAGHALQFDGENYVVPVDATFTRETDIPIQAVRLGDFVHALAAAPLQSRVVVLDGAYADPAVPPSDHVAPGLALVEADPGALIAFNTAPGAVAPTPTGTYGVYGQALAEMMRQGGVPVAEVFDRTRLRVNETTRGAVVPWDTSKLAASFVFLDRVPDAPATSSAQQSFAAMSRRPIREFPVDEAYSLAVARDTFQGYEEFLAAYPQSAYARRIHTLMAVRREALTWRQTVARNSPAAYWSYLRRYPGGAHVYDCRRRLTILAAALEPPPTFAPIDYDVPPPPELEVRIIDAPSVVFVEPDDPPPPPLPVSFLPPQPADFIDLPPPPPPVGRGFLPIPVPVPIVFARPLAPPGSIAPPRGIPGHYAQPQPFTTAPNGRLVAQPASGQPAHAAPQPAIVGGPAGQTQPIPVVPPAGQVLPPLNGPQRGAGPQRVPQPSMAGRPNGIQPSAPGLVRPERNSAPRLGGQPLATPSQGRPATTAGSPPGGHGPAHSAPGALPVSPVLQTRPAAPPNLPPRRLPTGAGHLQQDPQRAQQQNQQLLLHQQQDQRRAQEQQQRAQQDQQRARQEQIRQQDEQRAQQQRVQQQQEQRARQQQDQQRAQQQMQRRPEQQGPQHQNRPDCGHPGQSPCR